MRDLGLAETGLLFYACVYFGGIAGMATWEALAPRRALICPLRTRWLGNFAVTLIDTLVVRALLPFLSVGAAVFAERRGIGLLHHGALPATAAWLIAFLALDGSRYAQHVALHRVPWLWRLHRMHHTDRDYDFTTALRFHPLESLLTTGFSLAVVIALGLPAGAVSAYEILFAAVALFAHGNVGLPARADRWIRSVVITPDLHRVHHSALDRETHSNFASVSPWWDRAFGTYRAAPALGHDAMRVGLPEFSDPRHQALGWMLVNPWLGAGADPALISDAETAGGIR
jgi:sterol desaturase/sphingolipid hydroxylase (fatty acid hydroxylase superfamily)